MAFQVSATKATPSVVFVFYVDDDFSACALCARINRIGVGYDDIRALSFRTSDFIWLLYQASKLRFDFEHRP